MLLKLVKSPLLKSLALPRGMGWGERGVGGGGWAVVSID